MLLRFELLDVWIAEKLSSILRKVFLYNIDESEASTLKLAVTSIMFSTSTISSMLSSIFRAAGVGSIPRPLFDDGLRNESEWVRAVNDPLLPKNRGLRVPHKCHFAEVIRRWGAIAINSWWTIKNTRSRLMEVNIMFKTYIIFWVTFQADV